MVDTREIHQAPLLKRITDLGAKLAAAEEAGDSLQSENDGWSKDFNSAFQIFAKIKYGDQSNGCNPPEGGLTEVAEILLQDFTDLEAKLADAEQKVSDAEKLEEARGRTMDWNRVRKFLERAAREEGD